MGLFSKKVPEPVAPAAKPTVRQEYDTVRVNLSDKMLRVELDADSGYVKYGVIELKDDRIRIVSNGRILVAEITQRSKTFKELEPFAGRSAESIQIEAKTGDYGLYYQVRMKFPYTVVE